ncbi:MAG: hypothetical protein V1824_02905 [archaeon]
MKKIFLFMFLILIALLNLSTIVRSQAIVINSCGSYNNYQGGEEKILMLDNNITYSNYQGNAYENCIGIFGNNITLDCNNNYLINSTNFDVIGIFVSANNIQLKNCKISNFKYGVRSFGVTSFDLENISTNNSNYNISLQTEITNDLNINNCYFERVHLGNTKNVFIDNTFASSYYFYTFHQYNISNNFNLFNSLQNVLPPNEIVVQGGLDEIINVNIYDYNLANTIFSSIIYSNINLFNSTFDYSKIIGLNNAEINNYKNFRVCDSTGNYLDYNVFLNNDFNSNYNLGNFDFAYDENNYCTNYFPILISNITQVQFPNIEITNYNPLQLFLDNILIDGNLQINNSYENYFITNQTFVCGDNVCNLSANENSENCAIDCLSETIIVNLPTIGIDTNTSFEIPINTFVNNANGMDINFMDFYLYYDSTVITSLNNYTLGEVLQDNNYEVTVNYDFNFIHLIVNTNENILHLENTNNLINFYFVSNSFEGTTALIANAVFENLESINLITQVNNGSVSVIEVGYCGDLVCDTNSAEDYQNCSFDCVDENLLLEIDNYFLEIDNYSLELSISQENYNILENNYYSLFEAFYSPDANNSEILEACENNLSQLNSVDNNVSILLTSLENLKLEINSIETDNLDTLEMLENLNSTIDDLISQVNTLQENISNLTNMYENLINEIVLVMEQQRAIDSLNISLENINIDLKSMDYKYNNLYENNAKLIDKLNSLETKEDLMENETFVQDLMKDLELLQKASKEQIRQLDLLQEALLEIKYEHKNILKQIDILKEQINSSTAFAIELDNKINKAYLNIIRIINKSKISLK